MPKPKERAAIYVRESQEGLADSNTIESQAKAVREYCKKEGYDLSLDHEYIEAISAYMVPYTSRQRLMDLLAAARRKEFSVLALSEIRALSRRGQAEVFILYDYLKKYGVRLETIHEKFEDSAMGRFMLSVRAMVAEVERENTYARTQRGRIDRLKGGAMNGHPKPAYGYIFVDSLREQKAHYEFNHTIIYEDEQGYEWSEYLVCLEIFEMLKHRISIGGICDRLNDIGIPIPNSGKTLKGKPVSELWQPATIHTIAINPVYIGEVYNNRWYKDGKTSKIRPKEEWVRLPDCPSLIDRETFEWIQKQFVINKEDSLRNNKHPQELGLLRGKFIRCAICGRSMAVEHPGYANRLNGGTPVYRCRQRDGKENGTVTKHNVQIHQPFIDSVAVEKIMEVVRCPQMVRAKIEEVRAANKPVIDVEDVEATIADLDKQISNLFALAQHATTEDTITRLGEAMRDLEKQKHIAQAMISITEGEEEERAALEHEIVKFETWAAGVQEDLDDPSFVPTYEHLRNAVRILGLVVSVYPTQGDWPYRYHIDVTVPEIMEKLDCIKIP